MANRWHQAGQGDKGVGIMIVIVYRGIGASGIGLEPHLVQAVQGFRRHVQMTPTRLNEPKLSMWLDVRN
jgi:hypothetical protein